MVAGELIIILELQPIGQAPSFTRQSSVHQAQQSFTVKISQHGRSKALTKQRRLLLDLQPCQQLAGGEAMIKRSFQFIRNLRFKNCCAHTVPSVSLRHHLAPDGPIGHVVLQT